MPRGGSGPTVGDNGVVTTATETIDAGCAAAVEIARAAAVAEAGDTVGEWLSVEADGERVATHLFECRDQAYGGWQWGVQVVRASRAKDITVNGVYRLPGPNALLAPEWLPWSERLRPGDLGVGDLLPATPEDDRLELAIEDTESDAPLIEWGLGRPRVLSATGRLETAERWYEGDQGPDTPIAKQAPARCGTCGFWVPLAGSLGLGFGACANEFAPDDGRVVAVDHGCGAHSEGNAELSGMGPSPALIDEFTFEIVAAEPAADADPEPAAEADSEPAVEADSEPAVEADAAADYAPPSDE